MYIPGEGLVSKNRLLEEAHEGLQICANWYTSMKSGTHKFPVMTRHPIISDPGWRVITGNLWVPDGILILKSYR